MNTFRAGFPGTQGWQGHMPRNVCQKKGEREEPAKKGIQTGTQVAHQVGLPHYSMATTALLRLLSLEGQYEVPRKTGEHSNDQARPISGLSYPAWRVHRSPQMFRGHLGLRICQLHAAALALEKGA